ncbi:hypothetical protein BCR33DRAFT_732548 [Rhizoclosmatium globosum]|uniref:Uncharacterized protein n=1 Tax=Rhizoclosmatium globosum TaxID=329046 RepID=A0A1Y2D372_9FUNG|nr:hypothetical protein BCR33DRAFT_732548 [Rhizoclosmatium globosum]|eukprot:ORY53748.1 hypothetical protein BCR33DRAFT_732548 [Rhizoclosmatium globosum]
MSAPLTATTMDTQTGFAESHQSGGTFSNSSSSNTTAANSSGKTGVQPTPKLQMNGVDTQVDTMLSAFDSGVNAASQGLDLDLDFFNKICGDDNTNYSNSNAPSFGLGDASPAFGSSRPSTLTSSFIPSPTTPLFTNGPAQMPCLSPVPPMTQQQQQHQQQQQNLDSFASLLSSARPQLNHQSFPALGMCTPNFNNHSMNTPGFPPNPITNFEEFRAVNRQTISLILAASTSPNYNQKQLVQDFAATAASLDVSTPNTPTVPPMYNNNMSMAAILSGTPTFAAPQQRPSAINTSNSRKTSPIKSSGLSPQNSNIMQQQQQMLTPVFQIPAPMPDLPFSSFNNQAFDLPFSAIMSKTTRISWNERSVRFQRRRR